MDLAQRQWLRKKSEDRQYELSQRDKDNAAADAIYADLFGHQQTVVDDPYRFKSVITPRRAGKTHTVGSYAFITALRKPGAIIPIVTLTLKSAKRLYWHDIILHFSDKYGLGLRERRGGLHHTNLEAYLENGSRIFLVGAETRTEIEKLRGGSYDLVPVDECKSFHPGVFRELIDEVLIPATQDREGTILLIGTPGSILDGPFYEATYAGYTGEDGNPITRDYYEPEDFWKGDQEPQWSRHHWTVKDNIAVPHLWREALANKKRKRWKDDNPIWTREYLGQWVSSGDVMVYAYSRLLEEDGHDCRCTWRPQHGPGFNRHGLPDSEDWQYILGMDLGYEDDCAIVVMAYSPTHDILYHCYDWKSNHLTVTQLGEKVQSVVDLFDGNIEAMVADTGNLSKMVIESLNEQYGFFFEAAEKREKADFIELLNSDLHSGTLKIMPDSDLAHEWLMLQWDLGDKQKKYLARLGKLKEHSMCPNHVSDAALYTWRYALHHFSREKIIEPVHGSSNWFEEWDQNEAYDAELKRDAMNDDDKEWTDYLHEDDEIDVSWVY